MVQLLFAPLSDLDLDATVLKPYTIRVDWLYTAGLLRTFPVVTSN